MATLIDDSGTTRFEGTIDVPSTREELTGSGVTIADGAGDWLSWTSTAGPDVILDLTDPLHPTIPVAGVYLVSVVAQAGALTQGGYYEAGLHLDRTGFNASMYARSSQADAGTRVSDVTLAMAWYCPANAEIGVFADNFDGVNSRQFQIAYAHLQRLA